MERENGIAGSDATLFLIKIFFAGEVKLYNVTSWLVDEKESI